MFESGKFQYYDFGNIEKNQEAYNADSPPMIDLQSFSDMPIAIFGGKTDILVPPADYTWTKN